MTTLKLRLYNTLSRTVELFKPAKKKSVGLYTCGPTVYNFAHLGNLRTYIFEDLLERALIVNGYDVRRVMNITDVGHLTGDDDLGEDKIEKEARSEKKSVQEIVRFYTQVFLSDLKKLNIKVPKILAPASKFIPDQVKLIQALVKKGYAYETKTALYFDVSKLKNYGKLSGQSLEQKMVGARDEVVADTEKHNPADFALWFKLVGKFENHILRWPSPWGYGFPGWHVECSAIARHFLGQPFDIHTGGVDHIGTHHTNEIAQSEAAYGKPLANYWMHGEFLLVDSSKMAKSAGNFLTVKELENKKVSPLAYRYFTLSAHYRSPLNFSWVALEQAKHGIGSLIQRLLFLEFLSKNIKSFKKLSPEVTAAEERFMTAINNDLNIPQALAALQEFVRSKQAERDPREALDFAFKCDEIFGLKLKYYVKKNAMSELVKRKDLQELIEKRQKFRDLQQFIQADRLRKKIDSLGYLLEDSAHGPFVSPKVIVLD